MERTKYPHVIDTSKLFGSDYTVVCKSPGVVFVFFGDEIDLSDINFGVHDNILLAGILEQSQVTGQKNRYWGAVTLGFDHDKEGFTDLGLYEGFFPALCALYADRNKRSVYAPVWKTRSWGEQVDRTDF